MHLKYRSPSTSSPMHSITVSGSPVPLHPKPMGDVSADRRMLKGQAVIDALPKRFNSKDYAPIDNRGPNRKYDPEYGVDDRSDYFNRNEVAPPGVDQSGPVEASLGKAAKKA